MTHSPMIAPGIYESLPMAEYHRPPGISKTGLDLINRSPAHYRWAKDHPAEDTTAFMVGRAFHTLVLEPHLENQEIVMALPHDKRSKANAAAWQAFELEHAGKSILTTKQWDAVHYMAQAVYDHPTAGELVETGKREVSAYWRDPVTSELCKTRPDSWNQRENCIVDLKSAQSAQLEVIKPAMGRLRYHISDHMGRTGMAECGCPVDAYWFVVVEKEPPYCVASFELDRISREAAADKFAENMWTYHQAMESGDWHGYPLGIQTITMPGWVLTQSI